TVGLEEFDPLFVDQSATGDNDVLGARLEHITGNDSTQNALTQRLNDIPAFDMRLHHQTAICSAVDFGDHQVLSHVNQTTSQVTGVGGFQRRIRQPLTRTVGRDEVLKYVQTFTEVGDNRRLDDRAVRLGHQTTHTGQLTDLG